MNSRSTFFLVIVCILSLASCGNDESKPVVQTGKTDSTCKSLDTLLDLSISLQNALPKPGVTWKTAQKSLDKLLWRISTNIQNEHERCSFLSHQYRPEADRFGFVESLRDRTVKDTLPDGILYLIRFRGIFSKDKDITEFFSEEIAHVAYENPFLYLSYLKSNPGQKEMLLNTTRWEIFPFDKLSEKFNGLEGGKVITDYVEKLKENQSGPENV